MERGFTKNFQEVQAMSEGTPCGDRVGFGVLLGSWICRVNMGYPQVYHTSFIILFFSGNFQNTVLLLPMDTSA